MNTLSTLKKAPLIALLSLGIALTPMAACADHDRDRGGKQRNDRYEQVARDHGKTKARGERSSERDHDRGHGHKAHGGMKLHDNRGHAVHGYGHDKHARKHGHTHVIVREPVIEKHYVQRHYGHGSDYDRVRLLLGLHFDNFDIIFRD